ncbi:MAG: phosphodiesterase [Clostridiales bacterium]|nr:phosphodiesterase [Clostridiales bacterium]
MKLFIVSDIHGSIHYAKKAVKALKRENADYMIILGDILYHGARNPLPKEHSPKEVITLLNSFADRIIAVRGNCDSEVDEMVLDFPIMSTYSIVLYNNRRLFLTHGHIYNENNLPKLMDGDVLIYGHTHIPVAKRKDDIYILNPGSITFPKAGNPNSYGILENNMFTIKDLDGKALKDIELERDLNV